jgi:osmotically-inducible protein OsmY
MPTKAKIQTVERTDAEITRDVRHRMKADLEVPDDRIAVKVVEGVVTIEGTVVRDSQKNAAEICVRDVKGVREIANKIEVDPDALPLEG